MGFAILFGLVLLPPLLLFLLKSNPSAVFLSLTAGVTLQSLGSHKINDFLASQHISFLTPEYRSIILVVLPFLLAAALFANTLRKSKLIIHIVPALCTGALMAFAVIPLLPIDYGSKVSALSFWAQVQQVQPAILAIGVLTSIIGLMLSLPKHKSDDKKHH